MKYPFDDKIQLLFNESAHVTGITEYGISWDKVVSGVISPPPEGARVDIFFEGLIEGPNIAGAIRGVDYLEIRADRRFMLNIYATIITDNGKLVTLHESGLFIPAGDGIAHLQLNMKFTTGGPEYAWVNKIQGWGLGHVDMERNEITVTAFTGHFNKIPTLA